MINREGGAFTRYVNGRPETPGERDERIFPGSSCIKSASKGIVEEDDDLDELNYHHDDSGKFSNKSKARCDSSYFVDKNRNRLDGDLTDLDDSGRGKTKSGKGKYKCKDDTVVKEITYYELMEMIAQVVKDDGFI